LVCSSMYSIVHLRVFWGNMCDKSAREGVRAVFNAATRKSVCFATLIGSMPLAAAMRYDCILQLGTTEKGVRM
jgi:hypothetical protein